MRILVTDGDNRASLAVTRALGRRGHRVFVGERRRPALAQTSRYCAGAITYPDPTAAEQPFIDSLLRTVREEHIDVLVPVADVTTMLIAAQRTEFEVHCRVACPHAATVRRAADKVALLETAARLGVPVPQSWILQSPEDPVPEALPYPIVLKPHRSRVCTPSGWMSCSVGYAASPDDLRRALDARKPFEYPIILQECITGPGIGVFLCYSHGSLVAVFSHRRLREKPPWGGVSVLAESTSVRPDAREYSERLLREFGWHGVAMVEFKLDVRDGIPKLMEINGRFWGSLQLAIDSGVDFPNVLLDTLDGPSGDPLPEYRIGVQSRWFWGDVDSLMLGFRDGRHPGRRESGGRTRAFVQFLKMWGPDLHYDNPKPYDVKPWLHETVRWVRQ